MTSGEQIIANILIKENLCFEREFSFRDLRSGKGARMRFDFYVKSGNFLIEYDGEFHFHYIDGVVKKRKAFQYAQEQDVRKNKYALMNHIPLYRIPYTDKNKIKTLNDIKQDKYLVKDKFHNYRVGREIRKELK